MIHDMIAWILMTPMLAVPCKKKSNNATMVVAVPSFSTLYLHNLSLSVCEIEIAYRQFIATQ